MYSLKILRTLFIAAIVLGVSLSAFPSEAATITLRTDDTPVDAINSIALVESFASEPVDAGSLRATVFGITFSISAFKDSITLPFSSGYAQLRTLVPHKAEIPTPFHIDSRFGSISSKSGVVAWTLIPGTHTTMAGSGIQIATSTKGEVTLLVAYADTPKADREDRLQIDGMHLLFGTSTIPVKLNPSEVTDLKSPYVSLLNE